MCTTQRGYCKISHGNRIHYFFSSRRHDTHNSFWNTVGFSMYSQDNLWYAPLINIQAKKCYFLPSSREVTLKELWFRFKTLWIVLVGFSSTNFWSQSSNLLTFVITFFWKGKQKIMNEPLSYDDPSHPDYHRTHPSSESLQKQMRYISQQDGSDADMSELQDALDRARRREVRQNSPSADWD